MPDKNKKCGEGECGKPYFGPGKISKKPLCSGHYQVERRAYQDAVNGGHPVPNEVKLGDVRHYGAGSNQVSTRVTDDVHAFLLGLSHKRYPRPSDEDPNVMEGDVSALLREIVHLYKEGYDPAFESIISEAPQENEDTEYALQSQG